MQLEEAGLESLTGMDIPDGLLFASTPGASLNHPTLQTTLGYVTPKVATVWAFSPTLWGTPLIPLICQAYLHFSDISWDQCHSSWHSHHVAKPKHHSTGSWPSISFSSCRCSIWLAEFLPVEWPFIATHFPPEWMFQGTEIETTRLLLIWHFCCLQFILQGQPQSSEGQNSRCTSGMIRGGCGGGGLFLEAP